MYAKNCSHPLFSFFHLLFFFFLIIWLREKWGSFVCNNISEIWKKLNQIIIRQVRDIYRKKSRENIPRRKENKMEVRDKKQKDKAAISHVWVPISQVRIVWLIHKLCKTYFFSLAWLLCRFSLGLLKKRGKYWRSWLEIYPHSKMLLAIN